MLGSFFSVVFIALYGSFLGYILVKEGMMYVSMSQILQLFLQVPMGCWWWSPPRGGCLQGSGCGAEVHIPISMSPLMAPLTLISWNVRGMNSKIKHALVFKFLKQYSPDI